MAASKIDRQIRPLVVAHRGASAVHPENTIASFLGAVSAGADMIELDVRCTADGVPVVIHDADVSRTTNGKGLVNEMTLAEVKELDASGGRGARAEIPTFEETLRTLSGKIGVDVEIKNIPGEPSFDSPRESTVERALKAVRESGFEGPLLISSFNWLSIERSKQLAPSLPTGFITTALIDPWAALVYARTQGHDFVFPQAAALVEAGREFVEAAHADAIEVGTWTVDDPDEAARLFDMGVDAIASNDPAATVPVRDRFRARGGA